MTDPANFKSRKTIFGTDTNPSQILPEKLTLQSRIQFHCHPGVACFTACCGNITIILTPFDILRLKKRLQIDADEFLLRYTTPTYLEKTDMPGVRINLDEDGRCPFVHDGGCLVYTDRPSACRYYPIGMANFHEGAQEDQVAERFFFKVKEDHCKGHEEDKHWTVEEWRKDQGVDICDEMNHGWMELVMRRKSFGIQATLSEQAKKMFFTASTNLDRFRAFVFESSFLDTYEVDEETLAKIKEDDVALMLFSYKYLASSLFGTRGMKIKEEKIQTKIQEMKKKQQETAANSIKEYEDLKKIKEEMEAARNASKRR